MVKEEERTARGKQEWIRKYLWFLRALTYRESKRLVLKSPAHMFRLARLVELFPNARWVHIVREPVATVVSTIAMWTALHRSQGLQPFDGARLRQQVIDNYLAAYAHLESSRHLVPSERFYELKYEDLVHEPVLQINRLYAALDLGQFPFGSLRTIEYLQRMKQYRQRSYEVSREEVAAIGQVCATIAQRYGYSAV
jgi:hypothetical protein